MHSKLAPSNAARRMACAGSREMEERYPETSESAASREGTAAHWVAQQYLIGNYECGEFAPNGEPITNEMHEGADLYEHEIKWRCKDPEQLHIEERVDISSIHPDCWGTPDCWFVIENTLYLFDYKFGHGYVEVYENWQLLEYAVGIMDTLSGITEVTLVLVQPRCYVAEGPVRSWVLTPGALAAYKQRLIKSEHEAAATGAECTPSPECLHCRARHACGALEKTTMRYVDLMNAGGSNELTSLQLARELKHLHEAQHLMTARITGLEEQAKNLIMKGEILPGYRLESSLGREHWTHSPDEIITLGELMGLDLSKPREAITPAQARKLGLEPEVIAAYSERKAGSLKLVKDDKAQKVFRK